MGLNISEHRVSVQGDANALEVSSGDGCLGLGIQSAFLIGALTMRLQMTSCLLCIVYKTTRR